MSRAGEELAGKIFTGGECAARELLESERDIRHFKSLGIGQRFIPRSLRFNGGVYGH